MWSAFRQLLGCNWSVPHHAWLGHSSSFLVTVWPRIPPWPHSLCVAIASTSVAWVTESVSHEQRARWMSKFTLLIPAESSLATRSHQYEWSAYTCLSLFLEALSILLAILRGKLTGAELQQQSKRAQEWRRRVYVGRSPRGHGQGLVGKMGRGLKWYRCCGLTLPKSADVHFSYFLP